MTEHRIAIPRRGWQDTSVCLVYLPSPWADEPAMNPPLGLAYISAYLKQQGVKNVSAIDYSLPEHMDGRRPRLEHIPNGCDVYAVSALTPQYSYLLQACRYIRDNNPACKIVVGGPHVSSIPEDLPDTADVAIRGHGEYAMLEIIKGTYQDTGQIHGVPLDPMPFPDRDVFGMEKYKRTLAGHRAAHLVTLRGCPFNCAFCDRTSVGRKVYYRSIPNVISEIDYIIGRYGIRHFVIYDDIFTMKKSRVYEFCAEAERRGIGWRAWSRADTLNRDMLIAMKRAGMTSITLGIESCSDSVLTTIDKGTTRAKNMEALKLCKEVGVPVRCSLMYGNPGETPETVQETIDAVAECQPEEWNLAVLTPIPGSPIWDNPEKFGITFDKQWLRDQEYQMVNRFQESGIGDAWYTFKWMDDKTYQETLAYFVRELERLCPRQPIQDTIQNINVDKSRRIA